MNTNAQPIRSIRSCRTAMVYPISRETRKYGASYQVPGTGESDTCCCRLDWIEHLALERFHNGNLQPCDQRKGSHFPRKQTERERGIGNRVELERQQPFVAMSSKAESEAKPSNENEEEKDHAYEHSLTASVFVCWIIPVLVIALFSRFAVDTGPLLPPKPKPMNLGNAAKPSPNKISTTPTKPSRAPAQIPTLLADKPTSYKEVRPYSCSTIKYRV